MYLPENLKANGACKKCEQHQNIPKHMTNPEFTVITLPENPWPWKSPTCGQWRRRRSSITQPILLLRGFQQGTVIWKLIAKFDWHLSKGKMRTALLKNTLKNPQNRQNPAPNHGWGLINQHCNAHCLVSIRRCRVW